MPSIAIDTEQLSKVFEGGTVAVDGLTLAVRTGEVLGVLGHNGAGKTTTVRLLNGVLTPTQGTARVLGLDPIADGPELRSQTGVLTEVPSLDDDLTARENLRIYGGLYGLPKAEIPDRVRTLLETFELADRADEKVGGYSKGMRQRLALARTLIHNPKLLFLDEPTAGLDPAITRDVHTLIGRLSREAQHTILLCTHNLDEAQRLCDRVAVLEHGQLVALGTPASLARDLWQGVNVLVEVDRDPNALGITPNTLPTDAGDFTWNPQTQEAAIRLPDRECIPNLVRALVNAGTRITRVVPQEPTLEDIYFALHDEKDSQL
jgi:ABC-2 type transport system ATP-binding protein